jgi:hypothetical protein
MKKKISIIAFALLVFPALGAGAQGQDKNAQANDVTEYTFPDEAVVGGIPGADEVRVIIRHPPKQRSLIKVRTNFVRSLLKSVEDI